jgi:DedD protein
VAQQPPAVPQARGGWAVQVGAFGNAAAAQKLAMELQSAGYRAYLSPVSRSGKTLHRVRVGPEAERARAEGLAGSLKARGLPAAVVAND